jgi:pantoate kinase
MTQKIVIQDKNLKDILMKLNGTNSPAVKVTSIPVIYSSTDILKAQKVLARLMKNPDLNKVVSVTRHVAKEIS